MRSGAACQLVTFVRDFDSCLCVFKLLGMSAELADIFRAENQNLKQNMGNNSESSGYCTVKKESTRC